MASSFEHYFFFYPHWIGNFGYTNEPSYLHCLSFDISINIDLSESNLRQSFVCFSAVRLLRQRRMEGGNFGGKFQIFCLDAKRRLLHWSLQRKNCLTKHWSDNLNLCSVSRNVPMQNISLVGPATSQVAWQDSLTIDSPQGYSFKFKSYDFLGNHFLKSAIRLILKVSSWGPKTSFPRFLCFANRIKKKQKHIPNSKS